MAERTAFTFPKLDPEALLNLQKANLATVVEAHKILTDAARAIAELNAELVKETTQRFFGKAETPRTPEAILASARAGAQRAVTVAGEGLDLGIRAQGEVAELLVKRATANIDQLKAFAAAA